MLAVADRLLKRRGEDRLRVAVGNAAEAEFDRLGAADPLGEIVAGGLVVLIELRYRDRNVVVLVRDGQAERDLSKVWCVVD